MSSAPLGTTQISITWEATDIQAWATEYDERYQEIGQGWLDLWDDVAASLAALAETYGPVAEDLIQKEKDLNEEMWSRAVGYIGQAITFDGVPLAEICPFYAVDLKHKQFHELFKRNTILNLAAKAGESLKNPQVMTTVTFDLAAMGKWAQSSIQRYADIDRAYHEALESAFWEDVSTVQAFFQDIANQISETTTLVSLQTPKTMITCDYKTFYGVGEDECSQSNGTFTQHAHYKSCDVWLCRPDSLEQFLTPYLEEAIFPAIEQLVDAASTTLGDDGEKLVEFYNWLDEQEEILDDLADTYEDEMSELESDLAEAQEEWIEETVDTIKEWAEFYDEQTTDLDQAKEWISTKYQDATQFVEKAVEAANDLEQTYLEKIEAQKQAIEDGTEQFWADNGDEIKSDTREFVGQAKEIVTDMVDELQYIWQLDYEDWQDAMAQPGVYVKSAPTNESSYGIAIGAGACALAIGAFALYKKSKKAPA